MPRAWRALPLPTDPRVLAKAPDYNTFLDQEHDTAHGRFFLPRLPHGEHPIAVALIEAIPDIKAIKVGEKYVMERYPTGLSVTGPSGWKFMIPYDIPQEKASTGKAAPKQAKPKATGGA